jgi:hypothetical protein
MLNSPMNLNYNKFLGENHFINGFGLNTNQAVH